MLFPKKTRPNRIAQTGDESESILVASPTADRALWLEVLAVLSVVVMPWVSASIADWLHSPGPSTAPYWLSALDHCFRSAGVSIVVLYLIYRSGEGWAAFGITRLRFGDVIIGLLLSFVPFFVFLGLLRLFPAVSGGRTNDYHSSQAGVLDHVLMTIMITAGSFAEELVIRGYLITRLERLLRSGLVAVVASTILFASYHIHLGFAAMSPLVGGLVWGVSYLALRRIWPFVLAHMLYDIFCYVAH